MEDEPSSGHAAKSDASANSPPARHRLRTLAHLLSPIGLLVRPPLPRHAPAARPRSPTLSATPQVSALPMASAGGSALPGASATSARCPTHRWPTRLRRSAPRPAAMRESPSAHLEHLAWLTTADSSRTVAAAAAAAAARWTALDRDNNLEAPFQLAATSATFGIGSAGRQQRTSSGHPDLPARPARSSRCHIGARTAYGQARTRAIYLTGC
jgi:hypothetical protein